MKQKVRATANKTARQCETANETSPPHQDVARVEVAVGKVVEQDHLEKRPQTHPRETCIYTAPVFGSGQATTAGFVATANIGMTRASVFVLTDIPAQIVFRPVYVVGYRTAVLVGLHQDIRSNVRVQRLGEDDAAERGQRCGHLVLIVPDSDSPFFLLQ
jgi:hypothetical protein